MTEHLGCRGDDCSLVCAGGDDCTLGGAGDDDCTLWVQG